MCVALLVGDVMLMSLPTLKSREGGEGERGEGEGGRGGEERGGATGPSNFKNDILSSLVALL